MRETPVTKGDEKQDHFTRSGTMKTNAQLCFFIVLIGLHCTEQTSDRSVCGNPDILPSVYARIVGGEEAKAHSWPWQVSMKYSGKNWDHWCGGSVIYPHWVITAAHCFDKDKNVSNFKIVLGKHNRSVVEEMEKEFEVETIIFDRYNMNNYDNDIALIRLSGDVHFNKHIAPICLPSVDVKENKSCVTTGWGKTEEMAGTGYSTVLNQLILPVMNSTRCNHPKWYDGKVTENMICAGFYKGKKNICGGDSGGPLACFSDGRWELHGVISRGLAMDCEDYPSVYTRVTRYVKWIEEKTGQSIIGKDIHDADTGISSSIQSTTSAGNKGERPKNEL